ncbi:MAG: 2-succinyl-6-hydroxy-2,4-cyclohexadiene-1-carboxylate synthase [Dehalococcoidia bacterium]
MTRIEIDGLHLNVEEAGSGPPVVLLHGFTGAAAGWGELVEALSPEFHTIAIDIVGHGLSDSPSTVERYRMDRCTEDLAAALQATGHERATWLGYSMGGRTALQVAARHPEVVSALVLEGATPGLSTVEEREARIASDEALAQRIEREGVEPFIDYWESIPLFASQRAMPAERQAAVRAGRLRNDGTGLANSLRGMGTGSQRDVADQLPSIAVPTFLVTGALDTKFTGIGREMAQRFPAATMTVIEDAGHAAHIERPDEFAALVLQFLRSVHGA